MANHCSGVLCGTYRRVDFAHRVVYGKHAPTYQRMPHLRNQIIDIIGPLSWNELARSADFYASKPLPVRMNAIATLRKAIPQGVLL